MKNLNDNAAMSAPEIVTSNVNDNKSKSNRKNAATQKRQAIPAMCVC